jgi:GcrA cell cycle regulator
MTVLHPTPNTTASISLACLSFPATPQPGEGRRRWTTGEITEIVSALSTLRTGDIAKTIGVNPKALRSMLRRNGISLRALREQARRKEASDAAGLLVRRSTEGPSAIYGAEALAGLADNSCRWPLGDPAEPGFAFCGAKTSGHKSYCRDHFAQAYCREAQRDR